MYRTSPEDDRVRAARAAIAERAHLTNVRGQLQRDLIEEQIRADQLASTTETERLDVERLERGLRTLLFGLSESRAAKLEIEKQEVVTASSAHQQAEASCTELRLQISAIEERIVGLAAADTELDQALAAKQQQLVGTPAGRDLERLTAEVAASDAKLIELDQAIAAGDHATEKLVEVVALGMAADRLGSGVQQGALARSAQLARVYQANRLLGSTRADLMRFDHELADVGSSLGLSPYARVDIDVLGAATVDEDDDVAGRVQRVLARVGERLGELRRRRADIVAGLATLANERAHLLGDTGP